MKYVSISIATAGINPRQNDILELSAIIENSKTHLSFKDCPKIQLWIDKENYYIHTILTPLLLFVFSQRLLRDFHSLH